MLGGGITNGGLPYFAMELVDGEPIDRYCQSRDLSIDQRIDLFGRVYDAVSYAHQHLVIHRDLKRRTFSKSARVVLVGLCAERDHSAGSSSVRFPENGVRVRRHLLPHDAERQQRDQG